MRTVSAKLAFPPGLLLAALLLLPLVHTYPAHSTPALPANPHGYFQQPAQCPRCHLYTDSKLDPGRYSTSSVEFCLECHLAEERGRNHPLKIHAGSKLRGVKIPPEFRLGDGEQMICVSCHSAHGPYVSNQKAFAAQTPVSTGAGGEPPYYKTFFIRRTNPAGEGFEALCAGCHGMP